MRLKKKNVPARKWKNRTENVLVIARDLFPISPCFGMFSEEEEIT